MGIKKKNIEVIVVIYPAIAMLLAVEYPDFKEKKTIKNNVNNITDPKRLSVTVFA